MKKKSDWEFEKYAECFSETFFEHAKKMFSKQFRDGYYLADIVFLPNEEKWLFKFRRILGELNSLEEE